MLHVLTQTIAPEAEPVSIAEAKLHLRVDGAEEDALIASLITAARLHAEAVTRRQLIAATWRLGLGAFPPRRSYAPPSLDGAIHLPRPPLIEVTSVVSVDPDGAEQTLDPELYQVVIDPQGAYVVPAHGESWPATLCRPEAVRVTYDAGYGADGSAVPETIRLAILLLMGHWYRNREAVLSGTISKEIEFAVKALLSPHRAYVLETR